ncbi:Nif3-like dinuclear metal center hexameric protein [Bengtsoniella intestinalis]|uniref:Nif3-like dinuclear metal center hexameric protein n=1 Tax=Bengtsoniella intestinalis TaxID=3073143 RepID=UPI00391F31DA
MATLLELEAFLYNFAPKEGAMTWDNVGLLVGNPAKTATKVLVALDGTHGVVDEAIALGCDVIVTHHPIINCKWAPVQTLREDTVQGRLLRKLIAHDIGVISMHTNLDVTDGGVNDVLAQALGLEGIGALSEEGLGRVGTLPQAMEAKAFVAMVKETLQANGVRYAPCDKPIVKVGVGGGACRDYAKHALALGCDAFVTADVGYHDFQDAQNAGMCLVDAGHFPTENPVCQVVQQRLQVQFPELQVAVSQSHHELIQYYI